MTVKDLILELKKHDPSLNVLCYIDWVEEYGTIDNVNSYESSSDMPYSKGDIPEIHGLTVLIEGVTA